MYISMEPTIRRRMPHPQTRSSNGTVFGMDATSKKLGTTGDHTFVHGIFFCNVASIAELGRLPLLPGWRSSEMIMRNHDHVELPEFLSLICSILFLVTV